MEEIVHYLYNNKLGKIMTQPTAEQKEILKSYWVKLYILYGRGNFNFWTQPEKMVNTYWNTSHIIHTDDILRLNFATFKRDNLTSFEFTQKFVDEVVNAE